MRFRFAIPLLLALLAPGAAVRAASAQDLTRDRVQLELQRTDERIHQAEILLAGNSSPQASTEIDIAKQLQSEAYTSFNGQQFAPAARRTMDARVHADRAIMVLRGVDPSRVREQIDRTREFIQRARERLNECAVERARAQLHVAETMLGRSEAAYGSGRPLAALQLARGAHERARRALQLCRVEDEVQDGVERALHRTDEVLARARDAAGQNGGEPARRALGRAEELQDAAYRQFRAEHVEPALRLTRAARAFAQRALRLAGGSL